MRYHNIPSATRRPTEENIKEFMNIVEEVIQNNGRVHIHCKAGADRTGMYSYIYESVKGISSKKERISEWMSMGHHKNLFPKLINWTVGFVKRTFG